MEFSPEDATRSEIPFLCRVIEKVIDAGARIINVPDTVGYTVPGEFARVPPRRSWRARRTWTRRCSPCTATTTWAWPWPTRVAAVRPGRARWRSPSTASASGRATPPWRSSSWPSPCAQDILPYTVGINTRQIWNTSRLVANTIGFPIPRNKPITGENAFAHESGIHQDGVLKKRETYEIMTPESVGRDASQLVLGRHSGLHGFRNRLAELGLPLSEEEAKKAYERFLEIADRKKEVYDDDLYVIVSDQLGRETETYGLDYFNIQSGNVAVPTATVRITRGGERHEEAATGDGPVDAIFNAIDRALGLTTKLLEYVVQAVTPGKQAIGEVSVSLEIDGRKFVGRGASTDILEASARRT